jgi:signal transduction histidine kinase
MATRDSAVVTSDGAVLRVYRVLSISIGLGSVIFIALGVPSMIAQFGSLNTFYSFATMVIYGGLPVVAALVAPRASITTLRLLAATHAASALLFFLLWIPALEGGTLPIESTPWLNNVIAVAMTTAALSLSTSVAWVYMVGATIVSAVVRFVTYGGGNPQLAFEDAVMAALFCSIMITLVQVSLEAARQQDRAAFMAEEAAVEAASTASARQSRTLYESFAHDDVIGTLLSASRNGDGGTDESTSSALRALRKLDAFRNSEPLETSLNAGQLETLLRSSADAYDEQLEVHHRGGGVTGIVAPTEVGNALSEALREAIRNSAIHAVRPDGSAVNRRSTAVFGPTSLRIQVTDDGVGFDQRKIGVDRLGVRVSILRRVNSMPGAVATVQSSRRNGTTVTLTWNSPEVTGVH